MNAACRRSTLGPMSFVQRLKIEAEDTLRYSNTVRSVLCEAALLKDKTPPANDPQAIARSIVKLSSAARLAASMDQLLKVEAPSPSASSCSATAPWTSPSSSRRR